LILSKEPFRVPVQIDDNLGGEEDLSYVSGDERDFNESVQELRHGHRGVGGHELRR
jgi:hypothetical protein